MDITATGMCVNIHGIIGLVCEEEALGLSYHKRANCQLAKDYWTAGGGRGGGGWKGIGYVHGTRTHEHTIPTTT